MIIQGLGRRSRGKNDTEAVILIQKVTVRSPENTSIDEDRKYKVGPPFTFTCLHFQVILYQRDMQVAYGGLWGHS